MSLVREFNLKWRLASKWFKAATHSSPFAVVSVYLSYLLFSLFNLLYFQRLRGFGLLSLGLGLFLAFSFLFQKDFGFLKGIWHFLSGKPYKVFSDMGFHTKARYGERLVGKKASRNDQRRWPGKSNCVLRYLWVSHTISQHHGDALNTSEAVKWHYTLKCSEIKRALGDNSCCHPSPYWSTHLTDIPKTISDEGYS